MSIVVTPIPRLIDLAVPAFTLGTANAAGSAATAVASDSTLLAFDTTDPAAVAASAVVGSATTAPRRDHVHPGIVGAGTVVDEAIARFNGTSGDSLQGYSSLSPTVSDAGIVSLTSGALKFPATEITSADANTLDDYQLGSWSPVLTFATPGNLSVAYTGQIGSYTKIGRDVTLFFNISTSTFTHSSASGAFTITGLPFTSATVSNQRQRSPVDFGGITKANYTTMSVAIESNSAILNVVAAGSAQTPSTVVAGDVPTGGTVALRGQIIYYT